MQDNESSKELTLYSQDEKPRRSRKSPIYITCKEKNDKLEVQIKKPNETVESKTQPFLDLTGTQNFELALQIIKLGAAASYPDGKQVEERVNLSMEVLAEAQVNGFIEARLTTQANALYTQGMSYLDKSNQAETMEKAQFCTNTAVKLLRLHNETVLTLGKYMRKGEQKVIVQHVNVNDGGKALVTSQLLAGGGEIP